MKNTKGRVLCVTSTLPRWQNDSVPHFVLHLAEDLQSLGWEVDLLAPHAESAALKEKLNGLNVERFRYAWPASAETLCYQGGALINMRQNKSNLLKIPLLVACEYFAVKRLLLSRKYDFIHSHWILPQGFVGALATLPTNIPHIITVHGGDVFGLNNAIFRTFKRFTLKQAKAVTVNSSATLAAVNELSSPSARIHKIPMGIKIADISKTDRQVQRIREKYRSDNNPLLVFAGRLIHEKGLSDLIQAVAILNKHYPTLKLLILGEGQERKYFEALKTKLALTDTIEFCGWIQPEVVPYYLAAADIFIGPSIQTKNGWKEAQGLTFLEAMSVKTPVIATRLGGISDIVKDCETGLLVEQRAPEQIADAVIRLLNNSALAETLAENGYQLARTEYSRQFSALSFSKLFDSILT
ncbi:MAG: glycosyltransferase family 4 protein [Gammaproteobacteria bacterium]